MTKRRISIWLFVCSALLPAATQAQSASAANDPISAALKLWYGAGKSNIIASAEKMPETDFNFRPTPEVRSFSELLGHIADSQYLFCSQLKGEANPMREPVLKTKKTKAEMVKSVRASFSYCDAAFSALSDATFRASSNGGAPPPAGGL